MRRNKSGIISRLAPGNQDGAVTLQPDLHQSEQKLQNCH